MEDIKLIHGDSLQALKGYAENHFDVAIVDPPYGLHDKFKGGKTGKIQMNSIPQKGWDKEIPSANYFEELMRVSKNQIIWGGNYFLDYLPSTRCFLIWDKIQKFTGSDFEMAWTSFDSSSKAFRKSRVEFHNEDVKIHPTQKAVSLYKWILKNYTSEGDLILDTHLGSGSIAIAAHYMKRKLIGYEIDKEYYDAACKRFKEQTMQQALW
jgi:site-specific DNA-methyltransferase (adenine-specific)